MACVTLTGLIAPASGSYLRKQSILQQVNTTASKCRQVSRTYLILQGGVEDAVSAMPALYSRSSAKISRLQSRPSASLCSRKPLHTHPILKARQKPEFKCRADVSDGNSSETLEEKNGIAHSIDSAGDTVETLRAALVIAEMKAATAEREKRLAEAECSVAQARVDAYARSMVATTEEAMAEVESAKATFKKELELLAEEKASLQEQLERAQEDSISLALKVEHMASIAVHDATSHIAMEAELRIAEAESFAKDGQAKLEERIRIASDHAAALVMEEAKATINDALAAAELAKEQARSSTLALQDRTGVQDELVRAEMAAAAAQEAATRLEVQLKLAESEAIQLRADLEAALSREKAAEVRVSSTQAAMAAVQEAVERASRERENSTKRALEAMKVAASGREEAALLAMKAEAESLRATMLASEHVERVKQKALARRFEALERSLAASEASAKAWQMRAGAVEEVLREVKDKGLDVLRQAGEVDAVLNGGRMEVMLGNQSRKWQLLAEGPRRERPEWLRRKNTAGIRLPPLKVMSLEGSEAALEVEASVPLQLPTPDKVWSISEHVVTDDEFTRQAEKREREAVELEEQRRKLEKSLARKVASKRLRTPDELEDKLESGTGTGREIVFQGFNWESHRRKWYLEIAPRAADLAASGITTIWLPPPTQSVAPQGYMPTDLYNLNSAYGTMEELKFCIDEMHANDILVLGDVVLNHRCAAKQSKDGIWNQFGGKLAWGPEAIVRDDPNFGGKGNPSSGDIFHAAPNIDHSQDFVRKDIKEWMQWLRTEVGYDGWRLDFVKGFWGGYVKEYIDFTHPAFSIGEYWDSLAYEGGTVCYNQDQHRQRIINWCNATGGTSSAFDVTTKGILHAALHNEYWRLIDPQGKPPGVMGWWPSRAVTFLENHDTGSTQGHWPFPRDKLMQGYCYILSHPGTPVIFYDHFYDFGLHDQLAELISVRNRAGVHCRSPVKIFTAVAEGYAAQVGENLVMKIGELDWNPAKQDNLMGTWDRVVDYGRDYQMWIRN